ncbi:ABC transporter permease [Virgibacillus natechei]|uniref:ABC transporter permease n=1 Tax=Virgibacillus sp. CBA3643 TaxID=2942278 RepID=UPI0035A2BFBB
MIIQQVKNEFKKTITLPHIILWSIIILLFPAIKYIQIINGYVFYRQLDVFLRVNSDFIPLLFPLLMILVFAANFIGEQKDNYLTYVCPRIPLNKYFYSKLIVNGCLTFIVAFLMVFIPFVFIMYLEPLLNITQLENPNGNSIPVTTFEQLLEAGTLTYGIVYSIWIGINGMLYASFGLLLLMLSKKPLMALSFPFIYYLIFDFMIQTFGFVQFSPSATLFPFAIAQQPLWTVLIPFGLLLIINITLVFLVRTKVNDSYE